MHNNICAMFQVFPVKLSTCNLHGHNTRAGITARLDHISLQQYISSSALKKEASHQDMWLESGNLYIGPIDIEAAMALPNPDYHSIQDTFLKLHDKKTHRLWFLWPNETFFILSPSVLTKCGCHGGCVFFGNNKNGVGFFNSSKSKDAPFSSAVLQISPEGQDPGFGQSLLCKDRLMFDVQPNNGALSPQRAQGFSFTRGYMSDVGSIESPVTNVTLVEDQSLVGSHGNASYTSGLGEISNPPEAKSGTLKSTGSDRRSIRTMRSDSYTDKSVITTPSDAGNWVVGESSVGSPISETTSFVSRKGSLEESRKTVSHSDSITSYDGARSVRERYMNRSPNLDVQSKASSRGSLPSPRMRREDMSDRAFSAVSLESERYYSAEEDSSSTHAKDDSAIDDSDVNVTVVSSDTTVVHLDDSQSEDKNKTLTFDSQSEERNKTSQSEDKNKTLTFDSQSEDKNKTLTGAGKTVIQNMGDSDSTNSYELAPSDQSDLDEFDEDLDSEIPENFSMVDLHSQVNKPITESPILMSCYSSHMTQFQCNDWSAASPNQQYRNKYGMKMDQSAYSLSSVGQSVQYIHSSACVPHFMRLRQGFSTKLMKTRESYSVQTPSREEASQDIHDPWQHITEASFPDGM